MWVLSSKSKKGAWSGCEDVAVRVGCADDQIYFVEAVFDFVEADKLNVILPFIFEWRPVAMIAPDRFCKNGYSLPRGFYRGFLFR